MNMYKYPRTPHLPFSESHTDDDKTLESDEKFYDFEEVVVTIKMDGENTTVYPDGTFHARSLDCRHHDYQSWLLNYIQYWAYQIPEKHRICGEYLYARHSIEYNELDSYYMAFSLWNNSVCCSWDESVKLFDKLGIYHVPVIFTGKYDTAKIKELAKQVISDGHEGIVVRDAKAFNYGFFDAHVAKYVRANHVQTDKHWLSQEIVQNGLKQGKDKEMK